jgi:hypothetical protein
MDEGVFSRFNRGRWRGDEQLRADRGVAAARAEARSGATAGARRNG